MPPRAPATRRSTERRKRSGARSKTSRRTRRPRPLGPPRRRPRRHRSGRSASVRPRLSEPRTTVTQMQSSVFSDDRESKGPVDRFALKEDGSVPVALQGGGPSRSQLRERKGPRVQDARQHAQLQRSEGVVDAVSHFRRPLECAAEQRVPQAHEINFLFWCCFAHEHCDRGILGQD